MSRAPATWPQAAATLARRVHRRERLGAALRPLGATLLAGGAACVALKLAGTVPPWPLALLAAAVGAGLLAALLALARVGPVEVADAAWALDRLAGAHERGLVAAVVPGPVGAEAAWASGRVDPPRVALLPPRGLAMALGGLLAVVLAVLVPSAPAEATEASPAPETAAVAGGGAAEDLAAREQSARTDAERAAAAAAVREALGLGPQAATDPERVAERLRDPRLADAAREAAPEGSGLAALLAEGASPHLVAEALADGGRAEGRAREARRRAAAARAAGAFVPVPPDRRALLERYITRRRDRGDDGGR